MRPVLLSVLLAAVAAPAYAQARYFAAIEDVPLPSGFAEVEGGAVFAGAEGRIVVAYAEGESDGLAVREFYYAVLPQLGWAVSPRPDGVLVFRRGREQLSFTFEQEAGRSRLGVRLAVSPAPD